MNQILPVLLVVLPFMSLVLANHAGLLYWPGRLGWDWYSGLVLALLAVGLNAVLFAKCRKEYGTHLISLLSVCLAGYLLAGVWSFYHRESHGHEFDPIGIRIDMTVGAS